MNVLYSIQLFLRKSLFSSTRRLFFLRNGHHITLNSSGLQPIRLSVDSHGHVYIARVMCYPAYVLKASDRVRELDCAAEHTSSYSS